jgi:hypothetical protein
MSEVSTWSTTAASNNSATPDGWPEGQAASTVNDCAREMMAAIARWYPTVPLLSAANVYTVAQSITVNGDARITNTATSAGGHADIILAVDGGHTAWLACVGTAAAVSTAAADGDLVLRGSGSFHFTDNSGVDFLSLDNDGASLTTRNVSASEVGYKGTPQNSQSGSYTLVLADAGKVLRYTGTGGHTLTIPANASVAYPLGTVIRIMHYGTSSTSLSIAITSDNLYLAGTNFATSGTRALASGGVAVIEKADATSWLISGSGLT